MDATGAQAPDLESAKRQLRRLALDLRRSWHHASDDLWNDLEPALWARTKNPWIVLQSVSHAQLERALSRPSYRQRLADLARSAQQAADSPAWFRQHHPSAELTRVAYFSMEFMLSEELPIYSGGLGNVAGDQLKTADDLGVPVVGVGLLYSQGYFHQVIGEDGYQRAIYPYNDPGQLPVAPLRGPDGAWLRLEVPMPGHRLWVRTWQVRVGRLNLYLLDCNDVENLPAHRGITSELYGGDAELRLQQEIVLGLGGWRLLEALDLVPDVCHLNEGHAALAVLERARSFMAKAGIPFDAALSATRAGNLFTTHTAVAAGFDRFAPRLIERYLGAYARDLNISLAELLALGRENPLDESEAFNMAYLALRGSGAINAVSRLHGEVSRQIFGPLFPRWPTSEVPVGHVTNGVHTPTWDGIDADALWTQACGKARWLGTLEHLEASIRELPDATLWQMRTAARQSLVQFVRERAAAQLTASGASDAQVEAASRLFDPGTLTLGFARRFATYKRPTLLLRDPERFARLLNAERRPVQLLIAGKAHPADVPGQQLIHDWMQFLRRSDVHGRVIFLSDYDMHLTERLVQGVDVWINTPDRPWEACGTSGMKVLVNGGLNLSELDGWWAEAYRPAVGWALGDGREHPRDAAWQEAEALQLYALLETQVVPEFYARDGSGIPRGWVARVRESMATLTSAFSANRAVREYVEHFYLPAAAAYRRRSENHGAKGSQLSSWRRALDASWPTLRFGRLMVETSGDCHHFRVEVTFGDLDPHLVRVELYADPRSGSEAFRQTMTRDPGATDGAHGSVYAGSAPSTRPASDFTPRLIPDHPQARVPLDAAHILWQR
ncbi:MAG TPA: alpha-glucan family phosphorylase [Steroidobacteraceae bacterium]|nr:alpha-glucan family phosphorylase [Steroidobacteraceae bacterium]